MIVNPENTAAEGQVILIDKPLHWTSFDVVKKLKYALKIKKIGHAGTLDPLATGLLILCTGKKTKSIEGYQAQLKEYTGTITLGATTPSFDLETTPEHLKSYEHITLKQCIDATNHFKGKINQIPPAYSAIKKDGKRAYELARAGKEVKLKSREVEIYKFEITRFALPEIDFIIRCSKGTYIRTIANDFGHKLAVGGYLSALRRTKIGDFDVAKASDLNDFVKSNNIERV